MWVLGHILGEDSRIDRFLVGSVIVVDVYLKGGTADKLFVAQEGAQIVVGDACVEGSQDRVVRPVGAILTRVSLARS